MDVNDPRTFDVIVHPRLAMPSVHTDLDVFLAEPDRILRSRRIGPMNQTSMDRRFRLFVIQKPEGNVVQPRRILILPVFAKRL